MAQQWLSGRDSKVVTLERLETLLKPSTNRSREHLRRGCGDRIWDMAAASKLTPQDRRRIVELAARDWSGAAIAAELGGKVTRQAINRFRARPEVAVAVASERKRLIEAERERTRQQRRNARLARERARQRKAFEQTPLVRHQALERRSASQLGPNAREQAGLSALPDEAWAAVEDRERELHSYRVAEVTLDDPADLPRQRGSDAERLMAACRARGSFTPADLLALACC